jgi:hypothetical protein
MSECEEDVLTLQKRIIGTVSNTYRILRLHAHPKTWTAGLTPRQVRQLQISADGLINLPPPDARIQNLEMTSDLGSSIQLYKTVLEGFHRVTHTPEVAAGRMESLGNLSGVAIQLLFGPLIRKVGFRRLSFGDMLEELCKRLLDMGESAGLDGITTPVGEGYNTNVAVLWPDLLPVDELALRQAYQIDHLLGASDETLLDKLGYDPQLEQSRTAGEKQLEQTQALEQVRALAQIQQQYPNPSQQPAQQQPAGGRP